MANTGFVSCGFDQWESRCPNGMSVQMQAMVSPAVDTTDESNPLPRCFLDSTYDSYGGLSDEAYPVLAWDDANQIAQSSNSPYMTLFCNDGVWYAKFVPASGPPIDMPLSNPKFDRDNNVFQLDSPVPGTNSQCIYRFTFTCA